MDVECDYRLVITGVNTCLRVNKGLKYLNITVTCSTKFSEFSGNWHHC